MVRWKVAPLRDILRSTREAWILLLLVLGASGNHQELIASEAHKWGESECRISWKYVDNDVRRIVGARWGKNSVKWLHADGGQGARAREKCVEEGACEVGLGMTLRINILKSRFASISLAA